MSFAAFFTAAITSHCRARAQVKRLDERITSALVLLSCCQPRMTIEREEFSRPGDFDQFFGGPSKICNTVVLEGAVNLVIESRVGWGIIAGDAHVLIHERSGGSENQVFIEKLNRLREEMTTIPYGG